MNRTIKKGTILFTYDKYFYQKGELHFYLVTKTEKGKAFFVEIGKKEVNNPNSSLCLSGFVPDTDNIISGERRRGIKRKCYETYELTQKGKTKYYKGRAKEVKMDLMESPTSYPLEAAIWNKGQIL